MLKLPEVTTYARCALLAAIGPKISWTTGPLPVALPVLALHENDFATLSQRQIHAPDRPTIEVLRHRMSTLPEASPPLARASEMSWTCLRRLTNEIAGATAQKMGTNILPTLPNAASMVVWKPSANAHAAAYGSHAVSSPSG